MSVCLSSLKDEDFFHDIHDPKKWNVKCRLCHKYYKSEGFTFLWEKDYGDKLCFDCYKKIINESPSEEQIREWAEYALNAPFSNSDWSMKPSECSYENFHNLVEPMMKKIREERAIEAANNHKKELYERAKKLYDECLSDPINIIARLLDEIDKVKNSIPERDLSQVRFR